MRFFRRRPRSDYAGFLGLPPASYGGTSEKGTMSVAALAGKPSFTATETKVCRSRECDLKFNPIVGYPTCSDYCLRDGSRESGT